MMSGIVRFTAASSSADVGGFVIDSTTGKSRRLAGDWRYPGSHPSYSPDGKLFTTDVMINREPFDGPAGWWGVVVGVVDTGESVLVHKFDHSKGAKSWRISHPHPIFSPDGKRLYFNVSDGEWTRLHVAEIP
jgi:Tol biopolymer transport system component